MRGGWIAGSGALHLALGVTLGAFAAHGLRSRVTPELAAIFETGVRYQVYHALALLTVGLVGSRLARITLVAALYNFGIIIFSGSLYVIVLTGTRRWGMVTPLGGLAFIIGHLILAWSLFRAV